jgi:hypothetical protein
MAADAVTAAADLNRSAGAELDEIGALGGRLRRQLLDRDMGRMESERETFVTDLPRLKVSSAEFAAAPRTILHNRHPVTSTTEADCSTPISNLGAVASADGNFPNYPKIRSVANLSNVPLLVYWVAR